MAEAITCSDKGTKPPIRTLYEFLRDSIDTHEPIIHDLLAIDEDDPENLIAQRHGTETEKNLLLVGLLRGLGFTAYPLLIPSRDYGSFDPGIYQLWQFNHLLCYVEDETRGYALDTGDRGVPFPYLAPRYHAQMGLLLHGETSIPIELDHIARPSRTYVTSRVEIEGDGTASLLITVAATGYDRQALENLHVDSSRIESIIESVSHLVRYDLQFWSLDGDDERDSLLLTLDLQTAELSQRAGENLFVRSSIASLFDNPFRQSTRTYPIDFRYPRDLTFKVVVIPPENSFIVQVPDSAKVFTSGIALEYVTQNRRDSSITDLELRVEDRMITVDRYNDILRIFRAFDEARSGEVVIRHEEDAQ